MRTHPRACESQLQSRRSHPPSFPTPSLISFPFECADSSRSTTSATPFLTCKCPQQRSLFLKSHALASGRSNLRGSSRHTETLKLASTLTLNKFSHILLPLVAYCVSPGRIQCSRLVCPSLCSFFEVGICFVRAQVCGRTAERCSDSAALV